MTTATPAVHRRRVPRIDTQAVLCTVVLGIVAFCVVFPVLLVMLQSFQVAPPGQPAKYGLDGWRAAFDEPGLRAALLNTLKVTFVRQLLSLPLALRITVPVMAPVILSVLLLGTMVSLQTFEVEQVLGLPFRFFVFSTMIYDLLVTRVPRYDAATALAVVILAAMLPLVLAQQWLTRGRRYTTLTGQFQNQPHRDRKSVV